MAAITLITGKPRIGKTAFAVELLMFDDFYKGRKIFSNINGLLIDHHKPPEGHSWEDMHEWLKWKENIGSVVIYDEVQYLFPTRSSGSKMPEKRRLFEHSRPLRYRHDTHHTIAQAA